MYGKTSVVAATVLMAVGVSAPRALAGLAGASGPATRPAGAIRADEPIVLTGKPLRPLDGIRPERLVAFKWDGQWRRVPVQVDERDVVEYFNIYGRKANRHLRGPAFRHIVYTDPATFTGADRDSRLDANDEVVFMASDAGGRPNVWRDPPGVVAGSGLRVEITDPLAGGRKTHVFLFRGAGKPDPSASKAYVRYTFTLKAGKYRQAYNTVLGPNPEDSVVKTEYYTRHFSDRWIGDGLSILPPIGSGANLLDMHKSLFRPGNPLRSVRTFSLGEGAFVVNKSGPVRAIRSYIGANSGPLTQRVHLFYRRREEIHTYLRVHKIPGILDFFDYAPAATGMRYFSNLNPQGVTIDGKPDRVNKGALRWELIGGTGGSLVHLHGLKTTFRVRQGSYYLDDAAPAVLQVTGDAFAYGSSGIWIRKGIPNTDPRKKWAGRLHAIRILHYTDANAPVAEARRRLEELKSPLTTRVFSAGAPPAGARR